MRKRRIPDERSEKEIQHDSVEWLLHDRRISVVWRNDTDRTRTRKYAKGKHRAKGLADVCGMLRGGSFFAIEFKKPGGKLSEEQTLFLSKVKENGGFALVAFSLEAVRTWINEISQIHIPSP